MKPRSTNISIDLENKAIVEFISKKWTHIENLSEIVNVLQKHAQQDARALFDSYIVLQHGNKLIQTRKDNMSAACPVGIRPRTLHMYDNVCHLLSEIIRHASLVSEEALNIDGNFDFTKRTKAIYQELKVQYPKLEQIKPLGWKKLLATYDENDGMDDYDSDDDEELFKGTEFSGNTPNLVVRVSLPYVMYDHKEQDRSPPYTLINTIYGHFRQTIEYQNSLNVCNALDALGLTESKEIIFNLNIQSDNPILRVLVAQASKPFTEQDYLRNIAEEEKFNTLSENEKKEILLARQLEISNALKDMFSAKDPDQLKKSTAETTERTAKIQQDLKMEFGS